MLPIRYCSKEGLLAALTEDIALEVSQALHPQATKQLKGLLFMERLVAQTAGATAASGPVEVEAQADAAVTAFLAIYSSSR